MHTFPCTIDRPAPLDEEEPLKAYVTGSQSTTIGRQLGIPRGTVASRAASLRKRGVPLAKRPQGGSYPKQQALARSAEAPADRPPSTVHPQPSTVDALPSTVHPLQADLTAAVTAALQPVLARLEALETGLAPRSLEDRPPSTVHPETWELKPLKHSIRWTIYVPQAMREELQRRAAARGQTPSLLVQEALARWLAEEAQ